MRNLLFLSHILPYPPDAGVRIRTHHLLRELSQEYRIFFLAFYRAKAVMSPERLNAAKEALSAYTHHIAVHPIPQEHSRLRWVADHARSVLNRKVYTRRVYWSEAYLADLQSLLDEHPIDLVHVDSLDLSVYLDSLPKALPHVVGHHNIESSLLRKRALVQSSIFKKLYLSHQAKLMRQEEAKYSSHARVNLVVSPDDRSELQSISPGSKVEIIPNGVDTQFFEPSASHATSSNKGIVFVGGTSWFPNKDGLEFFASEIWPYIRKRQPQATVTWIGRATAPEIHSYSRLPGFTMTGYVDDIRPHIRKASCYVVPLRVGGGTRLKILDAWAMGKAVVSTEQGCEGLMTIDGENILIRNSAEDFGDAVIQLLVDSALRERLQEHARRTAEDFYSWTQIGGTLRTLYHTAAV